MWSRPHITHHRLEVGSRRHFSRSSFSGSPPPLATIEAKQSNLTVFFFFIIIIIIIIISMAHGVCLSL